MSWLTKTLHKIDPISSKVIDKVVAQDSRNVRSIAGAFGGDATGSGLASKLYREADANAQDPQRAETRAIATAALIYGGGLAYGAMAGGGAGAGAAGTLGATEAGASTLAGGAGTYGTLNGLGAGSYLGTLGTGSLGAGMAGASTGSTLAGSLGAYGGAGLYGAGGITALQAANIASGASSLSGKSLPNLPSQQAASGSGLGGGTGAGGTTPLTLDKAPLGAAAAQEAAWRQMQEQATMGQQGTFAALKNFKKTNPDDWGELVDEA